MPRKIAGTGGGLLPAAVSGHVGFGGVPARVRARAGVPGTAGCGRAEQRRLKTTPAGMPVLRGVLPHGFEVEAGAGVNEDGETGGANGFAPDDAPGGVGELVGLFEQDGDRFARV